MECFAIVNAFLSHHRQSRRNLKLPAYALQSAPESGNRAGLLFLVGLDVAYICELLDSSDENS
jgi:hypothetical protein